jgi:hypothetical protein
MQSTDLPNREALCSNSKEGRVKKKCHHLSPIFTIGVEAILRAKLMKVVKTLRKGMVPRAGVEPARPFGQRILSPQRLPFRHPGMLSEPGFYQAFPLSTTSLI